MYTSTPTMSFLGSAGAGRATAAFSGRAAAYFTGFSFSGSLPTRVDDRLGELLRADLLLADALVVDVVSVNAVLDRPQPGVVHPLGHVRLVDVHEHHDRAEQQPRRVRQILPRAARRRAVYRLEHRDASPIFAEPARPTDPAICAATSDRMSP